MDPGPGPVKMGPRHSGLRLAHMGLNADPLCAQATTAGSRWKAGPVVSHVVDVVVLTQHPAPHRRRYQKNTSSRTSVGAKPGGVVYADGRVVQRGRSAV